MQKDSKVVEENFLKAFFKYKPRLAQAHASETFKIIFNFVDLSELELYRIKGMPKRIGLKDGRAKIYHY